MRDRHRSEREQHLIQNTERTTVWGKQIFCRRATAENEIHKVKRWNNKDEEQKRNYWNKAGNEKINKTKTRRENYKDKHVREPRTTCEDIKFTSLTWEVPSSVSPEGADGGRTTEAISCGAWGAWRWGATGESWACCCSGFEEAMALASCKLEWTDWIMYSRLGFL